MAEPLWQWDELRRRPEPAPKVRRPAPITGFSIDTRTLEPGDVFVALKDARDGHEFVGQAFKAGAVAAIVAQGYARAPDDGALLRVDDPLRALEGVARAARIRSRRADRRRHRQRRQDRHQGGAAPVPVGARRRRTRRRSPTTTTGACR